MNIAIIGTGYVGLVTGVCLAELGHNVLCMDKDIDKISTLSQGKSTIYEPGLEELMLKNLGNRLSFTQELKQAVDFADTIMIAVGTPTEKNNNPDIKGVESVCNDIAKLMLSTKTIIVKSTVPVGTCRMLKERMEKVLKERIRKGTEIDKEVLASYSVEIVSNPEFLRQGSAVEDFLRPDRIVVGLNNEDSIAVAEENKDDIEYDSIESIKMKTSQIMKELYRFHINENKPYIETNLETSEMIKYASNAFLATKISFINELAIIGEKYGVDIRTLAIAMGLDPRIGNQFLSAGPGYGGSCFPKDTKAMLYIGKKIGYEPSIIKSVVDVNENQIKFIYKKIKKLLGKISGRTITVLGLSFKPETDDLRESPSVVLIHQLIKERAAVKVYDPQAMGNFKKTFEGIKTKVTIDYCETAMDACKDSECIIIMTDWAEFAALDIAMLAEVVKGHILIDTRNMLEPQQIRAAGFVYEGVGSL